MQKVNVIEYDPTRAQWSIELYKAPKDVNAQCGLRIMIDPGFPTGEKGCLYRPKDKAGLKGSKLVIRGWDNLSGWVSDVEFDLPELLNQLIKIMPKDKVKTATYVLGEKDNELLQKRKSQINE